MRFQCPHCKGIVSIDDSEMGTNVACGHCSNVVLVPSSRFAKSSVLGEYTIIDVIGEGASGTMYKAHQQSLDRDVAMKILSNRYSDDSDFIMDFFKEARTAAKLNHPNIVQAYAVSEEDGVYYIAMEFIEGNNLAEVLSEEEYLPVDQSLNIVHQIAEALSFAWSEQKLYHHRMIPDCIMITKGGIAKVSDLGIAKVKKESVYESHEDEFIHFTTPEKILDTKMDIRTDIYNLGTIFFRSLAGEYPFYGENNQEIEKQHLKSPIPSLKEYDDKIPSIICQIVEKMMAKHPDDRYQNYEELIDDIKIAKRKLKETVKSRKQKLKQGVQNKNKRPETITETALMAPKGPNPLMPVVIIFGIIIVILLMYIILNQNKSVVNNSTSSEELIAFNILQEKSTEKLYSERYFEQLNDFVSKYPESTNLSEVKKMLKEAEQLKLDNDTEAQKEKLIAKNEQNKINREKEKNNKGPNKNNKNKKVVETNFNKNVIDETRLFLHYSYFNTNKFSQAILELADKYSEIEEFRTWATNTQTLIFNAEKVYNEISAQGDRFENIDIIFKNKNAFIKNSLQDKLILEFEEGEEKEISILELSAENIKTISSKFSIESEEMNDAITAYLIWSKNYSEALKAIDSQAITKAAMATFVIGDSPDREFGRSNRGA